MAKIAFIGAGNLAGSLIRGLAAQGIDTRTLAISDCDPARTAALAKEFPHLIVHNSNREAVTERAILIACVKPDVAREVCRELGALLRPRHCVLVSVAAGITLEMLRRWTSDGVTPPGLIRCMPNTPVAVGKGMSVLCANNEVSVIERCRVEDIFSAVGATLWTEDETTMDAVTALSGSGPAYFFRVIEAMIKAAAALGMDAATAQQLACQTALGAAHLLSDGTADPKTLRQAVTSKGGTTECAIAALEQANIDALFKQALAAAARRSRELSRDLDDRGGDQR